MKERPSLIRPLSNEPRPLGTSCTFNFQILAHFIRGEHDTFNTDIAYGLGQDVLEPFGKPGKRRVRSFKTTSIQSC